MSTNAAVGFAASLGVTALLTPLVISLARARGWVARPRADRWSPRPTALMGGIAVYLGTMAGLFASAGVNQQTVALWIAATAMFALGVVDDRLQVRPHVKLVGQIAAACWLVGNGIRFYAVPMPWAFILTLLWLIGITNALNLLDNMDGLAAGVAGIAAVIMAVYGWLDNNLIVAQMALPLAGACAGFLIYNFSPAKVFMGDCGSMFLGFTLAGIAIMGTDRTPHHLLLALLAPVATLAVPIFDTTLVTIARQLAGRPVSQGGRDHSSHRLVALGFSERGCVLAFYLLTALFGGLALASMELPLETTGVLTALLFLALVLLGVYLGMIQVQKQEQPALPAPPRSAAHSIILNGMIWYKKQVLQVGVDALLIPVAYFSAHLLRFEGRIPPAFMEALLATLPFMMAIKLMALSMTRAYRGVWRYAGMADVLTVVKGSTIGSLVAAIMIGQSTAFINLSRSAFILDWLLFTNLAIAARCGFPLLRQLFAGMPKANAHRVLIVGAGPAGLAAAQSLSDPQAPNRASVVGFVDNDRSKQQRLLNGYPVLGLLEELPTVIEEEQVDSCVLAVAPASPVAEQAQALCEGRGIPYTWAGAALHSGLAPRPEHAVGAE